MLYVTYTAKIVFLRLYYYYFNHEFSNKSKKYLIKYSYIFIYNQITFIYYIEFLGWRNIHTSWVSIDCDSIFLFHYTDLILLIDFRAAFNRLGELTMQLQSADSPAG